MLESMQNLLKEAYASGYAVGAFNTYNYESICTVIQSADELECPAIVAFGENVCDVMDLGAVAAIVNVLTMNMKTPIALHLDHAKSLPVIIQAIRAGFTSVMFDGSGLSLADNIDKTRKIVEIAHAVGVSVEAELGAVAAGTDTDEENADEQLTDPQSAKMFVEETGVDALAVSIGTVHGNYKGYPKIDIPRLREIHQAVDIPLVLHGGSGTPESVLRETITNGVSKVNINTEISTHAVNSVRSLLQGEAGVHFSHVSRTARDAMKAPIQFYMSLLRMQKVF